MKYICLLEILLIMSLSFSTPYLIFESDRAQGELPLFASILANFVNKILPIQIVSAIESTDLSNGAFTCLKTNDGAYCQPMIASQCASQCNSQCVPKPVGEVQECSGVCIDKEQGTCTPNSPKQLCLGTWKNESIQNILECRQSCCIIGGQATLTTAGRCDFLGKSIGVQANFRPDIQNLQTCFALSQQSVEGACVYTTSQGRSCQFVQQSKCSLLQGSFYSGSLCSNPELETICKPQVNTGCVPGKSEVYWFDSCGNRENIYSLPKEESYNSGLVQSKADSCNLQLDGSRVCGNCNYLQGTTCGAVTSSGQVAAGAFVCRELSCTDRNGKKRENLESWCSYQGSIGVDESNNRATDTPGSRHFRETCVNGEIKTDPCADFRGEICVESKNVLEGKEFSTASCRLNLWQLCSSYNFEEDKNKAMDLCSKNPDCFIKKVTVAEKFNFNLCAPRYPPGFKLDENNYGEGAEAMCGIASQTCTYVKIKKIGSDEEINKNCLTEEFTKQMNGLCMSMGDCGASVNYEGDYSDAGYEVVYAPRLSAGSIAGLKQYANPVSGKVANPGIQEIFTLLGIPMGLGTPGAIEDGSAAALSMATRDGMLLGLGALAIQGAFYFGLLEAPASAIAVELGAVGPTPLSSGLAAASGALMGAAIGLAVVSMLIQFTGIGPGLDAGTTYALLGAGAIGGALVGVAVVQSGGFGAAFGAGTAVAAAPLAIIGVVIVVIVVIVILIFKALGIGDVTIKEVKFTCKPWQAPIGGSQCDKCGKDGFPCSQYSCSSLGQTCELINENTLEAQCIDMGKNDTLPPRIKPLESALQFGYSYKNVSDFGYTLDSTRGCLQPGSQVTFGLQLNEPGQCRLALEPTANYNSMPSQFGISSLYRINHTTILLVPTLESLGVTSLLPNASIDYTMYVRCQDKKGNTNSQEYAIRTCIGRGLDVTPPVITTHKPGYDKVAWNATSQNLTIYVNEPAECKYDVSDKAYSNMSKTLTCIDYREKPTALLGYGCSTLLDINKQNNNYYIKCKDQPWLERDVIVTNITFNGTNITYRRNTNEISYVINYTRTNISVSVSSVAPNGTLLFGNEPADVKLTATTKEGVDGRAICRYVLSEQKYGQLGGDVFQVTGNREHSTSIILTSGNYTALVSCEDRAGNNAQRVTRFSVNIDKTPPKVTRTYMTGDILYVITDEPSSCVYTFEDDCTNAFVNGSALSGDSSKVHTARINRTATYYISCQDQFGWGSGSQCNSVIRRQDALS